MEKFAATEDGNGCIYALAEPDTGRVRYIGQTRGAVEVRRKGHVSAARSGDRSPVAVWVGSLLGRGLEPVAVTLRRGVPSSQLDELEASWIGECRRRGFRLLNRVKGRNRAWRSLTADERKQVRILVGVGADLDDVRFFFRLTEPGLLQVLRGATP